METIVEYAHLRATGRRYDHQTSVRLGDAGPDGWLRPDGVARLLQDVATDDWASSGIADSATWVVRRTSFRAVGERWPTLGDRLELTTFCSGMGAAWAERRTNLAIKGEVLIEAVALWVPVDPSGRPLRVRQPFVSVYGESAGGRKVSGRVPRPGEVPSGVSRRRWELRQADLDVIGHVNNAALWAPLVEVASGPVDEASMTHHLPVLGGDAVELCSAPGQLWLVVDGQVAVSAVFNERAVASVTGP